MQMRNLPEAGERMLESSRPNNSHSSLRAGNILCAKPGWEDIIIREASDRVLRREPSTINILGFHTLKADLDAT